MFDKICKIRRYTKGEISVSRKMTVGEILLRRLGPGETAVATMKRVKADEKPAVYH